LASFIAKGFRDPRTERAINRGVLPDHSCDRSGSTLCRRRASAPDEESR
jgi:hypothetical protein